MTGAEQAEEIKVHDVIEPYFLIEILRHDID